MTPFERFARTTGNGAPAAWVRPGPDGLPREHVSEVQRMRVLTAMVHVACERGVGAATVAHVVSRAGVSRRTFYDLFENRQECFLAAFEEAVALAAERARTACAAQERWVERVRAGLLALLEFFEDEPELARICVVQALAAGPDTLARRAQLLELLTAAVDEGRTAAPGRQPPPLAAQGVVGGALGVVHTRLLVRDATPLRELTNPLMAMIALPFLGPAAARRELSRPLPERTRPPAPVPPPGARRDGPLEGLNMRLTYRTLRVIETVAAHPGASNRDVRGRAGIRDEGQISKLLGRLERLGLVENTGDGQARGTSNEWRLTARGRELQRTVGAAGRG